MIVEKIFKNGAFGPNIPEGLEYQAVRLNPDGQTYTITFSQEQLEANRITPAQGRAQLSREGKLTQITTYIEQGSNEELKIFWEYSTFWDRNTQTVKGLATAFQIDLNSFWLSAKAIEL